MGVYIHRETVLADHQVTYTVGGGLPEDLRGSGLTEAGKADLCVLRVAGIVAPDHPVWTARHDVVFKTAVPAVWNAVDYVEKNPEKEGLPRQYWPFVIPYDGWPRQKEDWSRYRK